MKQRKRCEENQKVFFLNGRYEKVKGEKLQGA